MVKANINHLFFLQNNLFLLSLFNTTNFDKVTPSGLSFLTSVSKRRLI